MNPVKIYVASSWRNNHQPEVVRSLRLLGHHVYDFKAPESSFGWHQLDPNWQQWTADQFLENLETQQARLGFQADMNALKACDACVLILPCGRSAHLELGWAVGAGKGTFVLLDDPISEPELMYRMCTKIVKNLPHLLNEFR